MSYIIKGLIPASKLQYVKLIKDRNEMDSDKYLEVHGWAHVCYHDGVGGSEVTFDDDSERDKFYNKQAILPLVMDSDLKELEPVLLTSTNKYFRSIYEFDGVVDRKP